MLPARPPQRFARFPGRRSDESAFGPGIFFHLHLHELLFRYQDVAGFCAVGAADERKGFHTVDDFSRAPETDRKLALKKGSCDGSVVDGDMKRLIEERIGLLNEFRRVPVFAVLFGASPFRLQTVGFPVDVGYELLVVFNGGGVFFYEFRYGADLVVVNEGALDP